MLIENLFTKQILRSPSQFYVARQLLLHYVSIRLEDWYKRVTEQASASLVETGSTILKNRGTKGIFTYSFLQACNLLQADLKILFRPIENI